MEKLHSYQGWGGRFHEWKDDLRARYDNWREEHPETLIELVKKVTREKADHGGEATDDYSHIYRLVCFSILLFFFLHFERFTDGYFAC